MGCISMFKHLRSAIKTVALGDTLLPQEFTIGLQEPQTEISIWLRGIGGPRDVTQRFTTACATPLTLCIAFRADEFPEEISRRKAALEFRERAGAKRVLGEIRLSFSAAISASGLELVLFRVRGSRNYCLPAARLWSHYILHAYSQWRRNHPTDIKITLLEQRAIAVTFIRPHFLYLISLGDKTNGNIFPMNLMGYLGDGIIGFALREQRLAAHLVQDAGRIALSGVPLQRCSIPFQLAGNHKKRCIDWNEVPFATKPSLTFGIPVPEFATRVREMRIELVHNAGSHRLFVARIVSDETYAPGPQACVVHGFCQYRRLRGEQEMLKTSLADHAINRGGMR